MKLLLIILLFPVLSFGQDYILTNLQNAVWLSDPKITDSTFVHSKKIGIWKLRQPLDSLSENVTIWDFTDSLKISYYDSKYKSNSPLMTLKYNYFSDKHLLEIFTKNSSKPLKFTIGITATGSFINLYRKKERKRKPKKKRN